MKNNRPYMKKAEWEFLKSYLTTDDIMLEYGSGSSTMCISPLVKELWSIEHHLEWFNKVSSMTKDMDNVKLFYIPQDKPRTHPTKPEEFETYINWIKDKDIKFDKVLVDGRARTWCAEAVLKKLSTDHVVFLHDYNLSERPYYKRITEFYNIIDKSHTMIALRKK